MKKILFAALAGCISALLITSVAYGQATNNITATGLPKLFFQTDIGTATGNDDTVNTGTPSRKTIKDLKRSYKDLKRSDRAVKNFRMSYKMATAEKWSKIPGGFIAQFASNGISNWIFYNKAGQWTASVKQYSENKLPGNIRHTVKSEYYDYKITLVEEIETTIERGITTYIVHVENDDTIKLVRVCGEEMDVYKEYDKQ